jgi:hypothetical protein
MELDSLEFAFELAHDSAEDDLHEGAENEQLVQDLLDLRNLLTDYVEESAYEGTETSVKDFFLYAHHVVED